MPIDVAHFSCHSVVQVYKTVPTDDWYICISEAHRSYFVATTGPSPLPNGQEAYTHSYKGSLWNGVSEPSIRREFDHSVHLIHNSIGCSR